MKILSEKEVRHSTRRRGFTFIEVLFAVILLGIGFIMIAAVFPVALQENKSNADETEGMAVTRSAIRHIQAIAYKANFAITGTAVVPYTGRRNVFTDMYDTADQRYGWSVFYRRVNAADPFMQVWVVGLQNPGFLNPPTGYPLQSPGLASAYSTPISATFINDDSVTLATNPGNAVEGAFMIVGTGGATGPITGRVFRLGNNLDTVNTPPLHFQLEPQFDELTVNGAYSEAGGPAQVYIIGRAPVIDPVSGNTTYDGQNQDLVVETSYVRFLDNTP